MTEQQSHAGLQTQAPTADGKVMFTGPVDALSKIYRTDGIRGIYHGQAATFARYVGELIVSVDSPLTMKSFSELHGYGW